MSEQNTEKKTDLKQNVYSREQYAKANFWEDRYVQNGGFFDWYAEFPQLNPVFKEYGIENDDKVLMVGCGNSKLSGQMFKNGYINVVNIDISPSVIAQMKEQFPDLVWQVMDATDLQYKDGEFDVVMDKGTLDALISGKNFQICEAMLKESMRVTKQNGQVIVITYGSPQGRRKVFQTALPFEKYDYYQCRAELNDMSTMINLMRSNAPNEPLKNIIKNGPAFAKTMKQFMIIKMMRKTRKNKKQLVVWNKHETSEIQVNSSHLREEEKKNQNEQKKQATIEIKEEAKQQQLNKVQQAKEETKDTAPKVIFNYQPKKQPYVYVYSIRRKLTYDMQELLAGKTKQNMEQQFPINQQGLRIIKGDQNERSITLVLPNGKMNAGLRAVSFLKLKNNLHRNVLLTQNIDEYLAKSLKVHIKSFSSTPKYCCLRKTNFAINIGLSPKIKLEQILVKLNKVIRILIDKGNLHPDPRVYALLGVLKSRRLMPSVNDLLQKYWFPSWKFISSSPQDVHIQFSIPPVNSNTQGILIEILRAQFKNVNLDISRLRQGFVSLIDLQLYGIINMGSLSLIGQPTDLVVEDFWSQDSITKQVDGLINEKNEYRQIEQTILISESAIQKLLVHIIGLY